MKRVISAVMSALLVSSSLSVGALSYGTAADETGKISAELSALIGSSDEELFQVWVWLSDEDKPDFDALAQEEISPKTEEEAAEYFALSEEERADLAASARLRAVKEYYSAKNQKFLADMGISPENVKFTSEMTSSMVLALSPEQIGELEKSELVESIGLYDEEAMAGTAASPSDKLTKEEFLDIVVSDKEDLADGGFIYRGGLKFDAIPNGDSFDLIVYGIKKEDYRKNAGVSDGVLKLNTTDYAVSSAPAFYSGCMYSVKPAENDDLKYDFSVVFYVENVLPGFPEPAANIIDASMYRSNEIASYIYPEITKGDVNNDGKIDASDASMILVAYSYFSTGRNPALNYDLFDWNGDGKIDSSDASAVLVKYAELSTTKN